MKTFLTALSLVIALTTTASAANIWRKDKFVFIKGDIEQGDFAAFKKVVAKSPKDTVVMLKSDGGWLTDGLDIGIMIRTNKWATVATDACHSVCAAIWLAGSPRFAFEGTEIGFHGAFNADLTSCGSCNALVGAYYALLGLSPLALLMSDREQIKKRERGHTHGFTTRKETLLVNELHAVPLTSA